MSKELIRKLLKEQLTSGRKRHVGVLIKCQSSGRFLLLKRAGIPHKGTFGLLSGGLNEGEKPLDGLKREVGEEINYFGPINYKFINKEVSDKAEFYYFVGIVEKEFIPKLDHENLSWVWTKPNELPTPLYPKIEEKIAQA